jgi:hypothetical protein
MSPFVIFLKLSYYLNLVLIYKISIEIEMTNTKTGIFFLCDQIKLFNTQLEFNFKLNVFWNFIIIFIIFKFKILLIFILFVRNKVLSKPNIFHPKKCSSMFDCLSCFNLLSMESTCDWWGEKCIPNTKMTYGFWVHVLNVF